MKPITSKPKRLEERLTYLKTGLEFLSEQYKNYDSLIRMEIHSMFLTLEERDKQVIEAIEWYKHYKNNHLKFMNDYPAHAEAIEKMQRPDYDNLLLEIAFEDIIKNHTVEHSTGE
mgnify:CR=1 FL=1